MKLLIVTQVLDRRHPILGFFHRWVEEFAKHVGELHVIALEVGDYDLPPHVHVHSLGKEAGRNRLLALWRFYNYLWEYRREYDSVFVHMNQIYMILAGLWWRLAGKQIGLWYAHGTVTLGLRIATFITHTVFSVTKDSFPIPSPKLVVTGHGIDTDTLIPKADKKQFDFITVGRVTSSKNLGTLLEHFASIHALTPSTLAIVGPYTSATDTAYFNQLSAYVQQKGLTDHVTFCGPKTREKLVLLLQSSRVFLHTAKNGSLDKAILEAMSVGLWVVTSAAVNSQLPLGGGYVTTAEDFVRQATTVVQSTTPPNLDNERRAFVVQHHSITALIPKILQSYASKN